ncbi:hypothetical protein Rhopal_002574-T1 [Rhodotorula paludigena]|uniref:Glycosyltransferase family 49 protein n=1 Tax=Rhodotorula paludigena TaxID=86838 RepID=A0AAV5GKM5_9BASI|nr:hypothetical protein Rhopal_002574-T1 [Rhodotorula paludigena]
MSILPAAPDVDATFGIPCESPTGPADITLVTQLSVSRLDRFERMLQAWDGPISAAVYLVDESDISFLEAYFSSTALSAAWQRVALVIVKPSYSINETALLTRLRYPINRLRNLAMAQAPSPYTLVIDVDFVPSPHMHSMLSTRAVPLIERPSSRNARSPTLRRTAIVIPTFALSTSFEGPYPNTTADLEALFTSTPPLATLTDANAGHGPTLPSHLFSQAPSPSRFGAVDPAASYEICFEPQWEPYYLLARASHPLYDERFTDQGGDKQSHSLLLNALGYDFRVLRDVWVLHPPKTDRKAEEWPAARLVQRGGRPERSEADRQGDEDAAAAGEVDDDDGEHFNLAAQRDETRFRYFQDFLPEMERVWGANVRWPRGCDARVVGRRTFGRAQARSIFGF